MSVNKEVHSDRAEIFFRPDMPVTLWYRVCCALFWLIYCGACVLAGYCMSNWGDLVSRSDAVPSHYHLSDAHYVYKKRPLPTPEEETVEENVDEQSATPDEPDANNELRERVKQAMADLDP